MKVLLPPHPSSLRSDYPLPLGEREGPGHAQRGGRVRGNTASPSQTAKGRLLPHILKRNFADGIGTVFADVNRSVRADNHTGGEADLNRCAQRGDTEV